MTPEIRQAQANLRNAPPGQITRYRNELEAAMRRQLEFEVAQQRAERMAA